MCLSCVHQIQVVTDHDALKHFMVSKLLTRRQARWSEFLADFDFTVYYRPGRIGTKADELTRRRDNYPAGGYEANNDHNNRPLLTQAALTQWDGKTLAVQTVI